MQCCLHKEREYFSESSGLTQMNSVLFLLLIKRMLLSLRFENCNYWVSTQLQSASLHCKKLGDKKYREPEIWQI